MEKKPYIAEHLNPNLQTSVRLMLPQVDGRIIGNDTILPLVQKIGQLHPMVDLVSIERSRKDILVGAEIFTNVLCGICGSDKKAARLALSSSNLFDIPPLQPKDIPFYDKLLGRLFRMDERFARYLGPIDLGHEGVVMNHERAIGAFYSPNWCIKFGQDPSLWCSSCLNGQENYCQKTMEGPVRGLAGGFYAYVLDHNGEIIGHYGGSMSKEMLGFKENFYPLPEGVSPELATLTDAMACALHGFDKLGGDSLARDSKILVIGGGTMGWASYQILHHYGFTDVTVLTKYDKQAELVEAYGYRAIHLNDPNYREKLAEYVEAKVEYLGSEKYWLRGGQTGYPLVVEAVGNYDSVYDAHNLTSPGGRLLMLGLPQAMNFDFNIAGRRGLTIHYPFWANRDQFSQALYEELPAVPDSVRDRLVRVHETPQTREDVLEAFFPKDQGVHIKHAFRF